MPVQIGYPLAVAACGEIFTHIDPGSTLVIFSGEPPVGVSDPIGDDNALLVLYTLPNPPFPTIDEGEGLVSATLDPIPAEAALADGEASFFRILDGSNGSIIQGSVGVTGGGDPLQLSSTAIVTDTDVQIVSLTVSMRAS